MRVIVLLGVFLLAACGGGQTAPTSRGDTGPASTCCIDLPAAPVGSPGATPGGPAPGATTSAVVLVAPDLPAQATPVPLRARLTGPGVDQELASVRAAAAEGAATPVSAGTYMLTYLDETGAPTAFTTSVAVRASQLTRIALGTVWVAPESAVQTGSLGVESLAYRIAQGGQTLKTVFAPLNAAIDLPPGAFEWFGQGTDGELPALTLDAGAGLLRHAWGSIYVLRRAAGSVVITGAAGPTLVPAAANGVEYLLPATTQTQGCMVYLGIVNQLTTNTITLCQDGVMHFQLDAR